MVKLCLALVVAAALGGHDIRVPGSAECLSDQAPASPSWVEVDSSPVPTGRSAIGWIGDYVYVFGNEHYPDAAVRWHVPTETWDYSTPCPVTGCNWTGAVAGGELYVLGRFDGANASAEFWRFTPNGTGGGTWTVLAPYPFPVTMLAMGGDEVNGLVYAAGGFGTSCHREAHVYSILADRWDSIPSLPEPRFAVGGCFLRGKFYVLAGLDSVTSSYTNSLYEYDPDSTRWFEKAPFPRPMGIGFNSSCVASDTLWLCEVGGGGGYHIWPASAGVYLYATEMNMWIDTLPSLPALYGLNSAVYVASAGYVFSTGGWDGSQYTGRTFKLAFPEGTHEVSSPYSALCVVSQNYPNPFNRSTTIRYRVASQTRVALEVYDVCGRLVRTLVDRRQGPGHYSVDWRGRGDDGVDAVGGVYFCRLTAGDFSAAKKMVRLR